MTVLHVTHSRSEALAVADRLFVLADRRVTERPLTALAEPLEVSPGDGRAGGTGEEHREPMGRLS
jgi:ABC-type nitrate/sulfonate/bicarbonate transport system ATPase subunit